MLKMLLDILMLQVVLIKDDVNTVTDFQMVFNVRYEHFEYS